jgi:nucleoside-diphosphate-sugar epimerase
MLTTGWRPRYNLKQGIQETTAWWTTRERNGQ